MLCHLCPHWPKNIWIKYQPTFADKFICSIQQVTTSYNKEGPEGVFLSRVPGDDDPTDSAQVRSEFEHFVTCCFGDFLVSLHFKTSFSFEDSLILILLLATSHHIFPQFPVIPTCISSWRISKAVHTIARGLPWSGAWLPCGWRANEIQVLLGIVGKCGSYHWWLLGFGSFQHVWYIIFGWSLFSLLLISLGYTLHYIAVEVNFGYGLKPADTERTEDVSHSHLSGPRLKISTNWGLLLCQLVRNWPAYPCLFLSMNMWAMVKTHG